MKVMPRCIARNIGSRRCADGGDGRIISTAATTASVRHRIEVEGAGDADPDDQQTGERGPDRRRAR